MNDVSHTSVDVDGLEDDSCLHHGITYVALNHRVRVSMITETVYSLPGLLQTRLVFHETCNKQGCFLINHGSNQGELIQLLLCCSL